MTPQIPIAEVLDDLATLIREIDRFPLRLETHVAWIRLRAKAWSITDRLHWLDGHWHTPSRCPSCERPWRVTLDARASRSNCSDSRPPKTSKDAPRAILEVPKSGFRPKSTRNRAGKTPVAKKKRGNPTAHKHRSAALAPAIDESQLELTFL